MFGFFPVQDLFSHLQRMSESHHNLQFTIRMYSHPLSKEVHTTTDSNMIQNKKAIDSVPTRKKISPKQMRVLLFRHASKCPNRPGECPVTKGCGTMKILWNHINDCNDDDCQMKHCKSSKQLLKQYSKSVGSKSVDCKSVLSRSQICAPISRPRTFASKMA